MSEPRGIEEATKTEIAALVRTFISESLDDPDIAVTSDDFKAGYALGSAEMAAAMLALIIERMKRR